MAYRSAEGAIEKMTSDLANSFQGTIPRRARLLPSSLMPTGDSSVTYPDYSFTPSVT